MGYGPIDEETFYIDGNFGDGSEVTGKGLFITNEGNFTTIPKRNGWRTRYSPVPMPRN